MAMSEPSGPPTVATGHLALTEELRDRIRERLLGMLDRDTRRLERDDGGDRPDPAQLLDEIDAIRAALIKLDAGYYGVCEMCEAPIPFERLDATPSVRDCAACPDRPLLLVR